MSKLHRRFALTGAPFSARVAQWTQRGFIQSLQTGTAPIANGAATGTGTIVSVNVNNTWLLPMGLTSTEAAGVISDYNARITLTNATTVTATRTGTPAGSSTTPRFAVLEFVPGIVRSIQYGTVTLTSVASNTATITAVVTAKTLVGYLGAQCNASSGIAGSQFDLDVQLTNATTVTVTGNNSVNTWIAGFVVVEFY